MRDKNIFLLTFQLAVYLLTLFKNKSDTLPFLKGG